MQTSARVLIALAATFIFGSLAAAPATAQEKSKAGASQDKKASAATANQKILLENDKVKAFEVRFKPGEQGANVKRPARVVRALKGGTLMRMYADGKTEKVQWKTGEVKWLGPDPVFAPKNVGKTEVVLYVVELK
jgi:hypothetical protein